MCSHFQPSSSSSISSFLFLFFFSLPPSLILSFSPHLVLAFDVAKGEKTKPKKTKKGVHRPHGKRSLAFPPRASSLWLSFFIMDLNREKKERRERERDRDRGETVDRFSHDHERCQVCSPWSRSILTRQDVASRLSSLRTRALADQRAGILATGHHGRGGDRKMGSKAR